MAEEVFEIRCPVCGHIFIYKIGNVKFDEEYPIGYVECPACQQHINTLLDISKKMKNRRSSKTSFIL